MHSLSHTHAINYIYVSRGEAPKLGWGSIRGVGEEEEVRRNYEVLNRAVVGSLIRHLRVKPPTPSYIHLAHKMTQFKSHFVQPKSRVASC